MVVSPLVRSEQTSIAPNRLEVRLVPYALVHCRPPHYLVETVFFFWHDGAPGHEYLEELET